MLYNILQNKVWQTVSSFTSLAMWLGSFIIAAVKKNTICIWLMFGAYTA